VKVSLEWLADFVDVPASVTPADIARDLTLKTVEVEGLEDLGAALRDVVVGRVVAVAADRVTCDVGETTVTVVSRRPDIAVGQLVAVAAGERIRTPADLGLQKLFPDASAPALPIDGVDASAGQPLAAVLHWNDVVLEIDNKSLTNRPDLWGHYGIARELAAIYNRPLKPLAAGRRPDPLDGLVGLLDPALCSRLTLTRFSVDATTPAPLWLRSRLARIGEGSVGLCVDLSNYVMFTVGQPTHVYDAARLRLPLSVTTAGSTVKMELLGGESRELDPATPVVRDGDGPVALAGVVGGAGSAVTPGSTTFVLEAASFRPAPIRRATQRLGVRTEASARFEKGLDTQRVDAAVGLFVRLLTDAAPGARVLGMHDVELAPTAPLTVDLDPEFLARRIGQRLDHDEVVRILRSLGFGVAAGGSGRLDVTVPTWRATGDVSTAHDLLEEVARIHGFDNIPVAPLTVTLDRIPRQNRRPLDRAVREELAARAGMQEVITYPWASDAMLAAAGLDKAATIRFEGAPAPDRDALRPSLVPNLLEATAANLRHQEAFALFEVGRTFSAGPLAPLREGWEPLPVLPRRLAGVLVGSDGALLFRRAKGVLEMLRRRCHVEDLRGGAGGPVPGWADQAARLGLTAGDREVGTLALLSTRCRRLAGIEGVQVACFELALDGLKVHPSRENRYEPVPELPGAEFDLSVVVADRVSYADVVDVTTAVGPPVRRVGLVDEFRSDRLPAGHRSLTVRLTLQPTRSTLTAEEIAATRTAVIAALEQRLAARLR
jgi:phenylalanyl-tRNA synthetase beta chain